MKYEDKGKMLGTKGNLSFDAEMQKVDASPAHTPGYKGGVKLAQSSNLQASFTLFKSFIGTGILALPYAYSRTGLGLSIIIIVFVAIITTHCFMLLLDVADDKYGRNRVSLQKLAQEVLGDKGKYAVQFSMIVMQLGCCIGILIFTKSFLNHVLCQFNVTALCDNLAFNIAFCIALTVPLSLINNMHYFYIPSLAANFFIIIGLMSQMYYNIQILQTEPAARPGMIAHLSEFRILQLPLFFGIATFAFEGIGILFSIRDSMENPQDFRSILKKQMVILCVIYIVFPTFCYVVLGNTLTDIVFFSLPTSNSFYLLVQILYAMSALFTYPIQMFPALRILENSKILRYRIFNEKGKTKNKKLRYGVRFTVIALVFVVAYLANSFQLFLNLLGSCVFTFIGFVVPIWVFHVHFSGRIRTKTKIGNFIILAVVIFFGVTGFVMSIIKMAKMGSSDENLDD